MARNRLATGRTRTAALTASAAAAALVAIPQNSTAATYSDPSSVGTPSIARASDPSGVGIPSISGWTLKFGDDFTGSAISPAWAVYKNEHSHRGPKLAANVDVHDGMVTLKVTKRNGEWTGSGICASRVTTGTYGRYLLRVRYGHGLGTRATAMLWPTSGWPPEVDFMEYDARDAQHHLLMLTNHYNAGGQTNLMQHAFIPGDYREWHTIGLEWTPNELKYTLDGQTTAVMTGHVPSQPMWVGIANSLGNLTKPDASDPDSVDLDIDWFAYYKQS
jgi:beta-glucanase (GH16 family)